MKNMFNTKKRRDPQNPPPGIADFYRHTDPAPEGQALFRFILEHSPIPQLMNLEFAGILDCYSNWLSGMTKHLQDASTAISPLDAMWKSLSIKNVLEIQKEQPDEIYKMNLENINFAAGAALKAQQIQNTYTPGCDGRTLIVLARFIILGRQVNRKMMTNTDSDSQKVLLQLYKNICKTIKFINEEMQGLPPEVTRALQDETAKDTKLNLKAVLFDYTNQYHKRKVKGHAQIL